MGAPCQIRHGDRADALLPSFTWPGSNLAACLLRDLPRFPRFSILIIHAACVGCLPFIFLAVSTTKASQPALQSQHRPLPMSGPAAYKMERISLVLENAVRHLPHRWLQTTDRVSATNSIKS